LVKVTIRGETYSFDPRYPMSEAIALEEGLGWTFGEWQAQLGAGSARAMCGYLWLVLRRNGQDVPLQDLLSGKFELGADDFEIEDEDAAAPDPTGSPPRLTTTSGGGSPSSARSSDSPRRRSAP
jgi:hypothetical protein